MAFSIMIKCILIILSITLLTSHSPYKSYVCLFVFKTPLPPFITNKPCKKEKYVLLEVVRFRADLQIMQKVLIYCILCFS